MTSDSLAAWLAGEIGATDVALVKSCAVDPAATLDDFTASGIVDPLFRDYVEKLNLSWSVIGEGDDAALARLVAASSERH
jgi:hypothetical protein